MKLLLGLVCAVSLNSFAGTQNAIVAKRQLNHPGTRIAKINALDVASIFLKAGQVVNFTTRTNVEKDELTYCLELGDEFVGHAGAIKYVLELDYSLSFQKSCI